MKSLRLCYECVCRKRWWFWWLTDPSWTYCLLPTPSWRIWDGVLILCAAHVCSWKICNVFSLLRVGERRVMAVYDALRIAFWREYCISLSKAYCMSNCHWYDLLFPCTEFSLSKISLFWVWMLLYMSRRQFLKHYYLIRN